MRQSLLLGALACVTLSAWGGEIIFVDPVREKAQRLQPQEDGAARHEQLRERVLEDARLRSGREAVPNATATDGEPMSPAGERAREARDYLNDTPVAQPAAILRNAPPPTDAAKARQTARGWVAPPAANSTNASGNRCKTENTVGGIEGSAQGHTVIQSNTSSVATICK